MSTNDRIEIPGGYSVTRQQYETFLAQQAALDEVERQRSSRLAILRAAFIAREKLVAQRPWDSERLSIANACLEAAANRFVR